VNFGAITLGHKVRRDILTDHRTGSDHGDIAEAHKLVNTGKTTNDNSIADDHVPRQSGAIREYTPVSNEGVMANMGVSHKEILIPDLRNHPPAGRARLKGYTLANYVAIADDELTRLSTVLEVLRHRTNRSELKDSISIPNPRVPLDHNVRTDGVIATKNYMGTDDRVRSNLRTLSDRGRRIDYSGGMNETHERDLVRLRGRSGEGAAYDNLTVNEYLSVHYPEGITFFDTLHHDLELVARDDHLLPFKVVSADQVKGFIPQQLRLAITSEHSGGLSHRFHDQYPRHYRMAWKMALKELFISRHVLDCCNMHVRN